ncbi:MAG TPA: hypothetical protein VHZ95_05510, partial [Polyangiales bacterium]|nr:hypothetical protein [Polyangiales bacterium]
MNRLLAVYALSLLLACTVERTNVVSDPPADPPVQTDGAAPPPDAASVRDGAIAQQPSARCGKHDCACDDGIDNDGDGLVDGFDPECSGSFDDDESSFGIGKPNKQGACRDCFWDDNAGNGDDGCRYPAACLSGDAPS